MLFTVIILALYYDVQTLKIKNKITVSYLVLGLILNTLLSGSQGLVFGLMGMIIGLLSLFWLYLLGGVGAGDVKLFAAIGAIMGKSYIIDLAIYSSICAGIVGICAMIYYRKLQKSFKNIFSILLSIILFKSPKTVANYAKETSLKIPYMIAVLPGAVLEVFWPLHIWVR